LTGLFSVLQSIDVHALFFLKVFKMSDAVLGLIGFSSYMLNSGMYAIASQSSHLYVAATLSCLRGIAGPMSRSILSTVSSKEDVGKIFSLTTSIESLSALIAGEIDEKLRQLHLQHLWFLLSVPLYTLVYDKTLDFFPGAFNVISLGAHFGCFAAVT
jgi:MFS transporter, PCFT/HCP family, solute carrier family 46 (folate transporter), member 1